MNEIDFIKNQPIFENLTPQELEMVNDILKLESYAPNETIIRENDLSQDLYFIKEGEVEVIKKNEERGEEFVIKKLHKGDLIGEMAFIDRGPRSSSVRVINYPALIYKFSFDRSDPKFSTLYTKIVEKIGQLSMMRLRSTSQDYVQTLKDQIKQLIEQNQFGYFFVFIATVYNLNNFARFFLPRDLSQIPSLVLIFFSFLFFLPTIGFLKYNDYPLQEFGLPLRQNWKTLKETFFLSITGLSFFALIYSTWLKTWPLFLNDLHSILSSLLSFQALALFMYVFSVEFVIRGTIQTSLKKFLSISNINTILLTSLMIWPTNLYLGFELSFLKFFLDLCLGYIYFHQKNVLGVAILHFLFVICSGILL